MYSDPDSWLGQGEHRFFSAPKTPFYVQTHGDVIEVMIWDANEHWTMQVAPPPGQRLQPGVYAAAVEPSNRTGSHPGLIVYGDGRHDGGYGFFEVKDVAFGADGSVSRLWIVWVMQIRASPATFGELRYNVPLAPGQLAADPTRVRWGPFDVGRTGVSVPVRLAPSGDSGRVATVAVEGADAALFPLQADGCSGRSLGEGEYCTVEVAFRPAEPGTRRAALHVTDGSGASLLVPLDGYVYGGRTRLVLDSDPGDYVGQGRHYEYQQGSALVDVSATRDGWSFGLRHPSDWWSGVFEVADGDTLRPGTTYTGAQRVGYNGDGPGIDVVGNGRGCSRMAGDFTVRDLEIDQDGRSTEFAGSFVEHCEGAEPAFRGLVEFRAGNDVPPPPWGLPQMPAGAPSWWTTGDPPGSEADPGAQQPGATGAPTAPVDTQSGPGANAPAGDARGQRRTAGRYGHPRCPGRTFGRADAIEGRAAADRLHGSSHAELFRAGAGADRILAGAGADCIDAGRGDDKVRAGRGNDIVVAGRGSDRVDCGAGRDLAYAGRRDRVRGCEHVIRAGGRGGGSRASRR
jgi:hypothetical protein